MGIRTGVVSLLLGLMVEPAMGRYIFEDFHLLPSYIKAHGVIMGLVFCVMMPLGVIAIGLLNVRGSIWIHAGWQLISWCLMIAGFGLGVRIARITDNAYNNAHTKIGTIVVAMLLVQPLFGLIHHIRFRKTHKPSAWTHLHVWYGRALMLLGIINGGLGLQLAKNSPGGEIAYGIVGGILGACVLLVATFTEYKRWFRPRSLSQLPPVAEARG